MESAVHSNSQRNTTTEARRKAILQAALTLFLDKGFTDTTMEDIRQLSGASTGSIYHHFSNKESIALDIYREGRDEVNKVLRAALQTDQPQAGIQAAVHAYLDWFAQHSDVGQYLLQAANTEYLGPQVAVLRRHLDLFSDYLLEWLQPFIDAGLVKRYPPQLYAPLVLGPCREFARRWLATRSLAELTEAREPLAVAAWLVLAPQD
jgi:AcrR family transcriptional regulator